MVDMVLQDGTKIHFIGIGGVGMSGIAEVAASRGYRVSGSDLKDSREVRKLVADGIRVEVGHRAETIDEIDPDIVVISSAIPAKNPELVRARELGKPVLARAEMLSYLGRGRKTLAVAGTHGKTTTSSMLATVLERMGTHPTFIVGGTLDGYDTNALAGDGEYFVVEADESDGSFVFLDPFVAIVTNIEADHLDHYSDLDDIDSTFLKFMSSVPEDGAIVICGDNPRLPRLAASSGRRVITYGRNADCDVTYEMVSTQGISSNFSVHLPDGRDIPVHLTSNPGIHNAGNASAVLAAVWFLGLPCEEAAEKLGAFTGVRRRFDHIASVGGVEIVDDYGHHPTEVKATIEAAAGLGYGRVCVLFQPHRYSRTESLADLFGSAFDSADDVTVMDVYSAGEAPIPGVSGKLIVNSILKHDPDASVTWMPHRGDVVEHMASKLRSGDLLLTMGAGDVTVMGPLIAEALRGKAGE